LALVAQRGCGVSIIGNIQKLSGYSPGQSALGVPDQSGGWTPLPTSTVKSSP